MQATLTTTEEVMRALGGTRAVAELTGRKYTAAAHWFKFDAFPANTFLIMKAALEAQGLSAPPSLWGIPTPEKMSGESAA